MSQAWKIVLGIDFSAVSLTFASELANEKATLSFRNDNVYQPFFVFPLPQEQKGYSRHYLGEVTSIPSRGNAKEFLQTSFYVALLIRFHFSSNLGWKILFQSSFCEYLLQTSFTRQYRRCSLFPSAPKSENKCPSEASFSDFTLNTDLFPFVFPLEYQEKRKRKIEEIIRRIVIEG